MDLLVLTIVYVGRRGGVGGEEEGRSRGEEEGRRGGGGEEGRRW